MLIKPGGTLSQPHPRLIGGTGTERLLPSPEWDPKPFTACDGTQVAKVNVVSVNHYAVLQG